MTLFFDVINNGKLIPFGSKSDTSHNAIFNSTMSDVFLGFYPNNSNNEDYDNYENNIIIGTSNLNNYYEGYIATKNNKLIKFNDYNVITNSDIITYNGSLGNISNLYDSISISSNIFLNNINISSYSSNIYIINDLLINNLNITDNIFTELLKSSNLYTNNLYVKNIITSNIYSSNIVAKNLLANILESYNSIINNINANTIKTVNIYSSNIEVYNNIFTSNIKINKSISSYIFSSNIKINSLITNTFKSYSNDSLGTIKILNDILPSVNNSNDIGKKNNKFSKIYINDSIISDCNILKTSLSNIIINNNAVIDNIYIYSSRSQSLYVNNITNINNNGNDIFNNIINIDNIYTNIIITSNLSSLNNIISKNILSKNIKTDNYISSNFTILGLLYNNNNTVEIINNFNIYSSNLKTNDVHTYNLNMQSNTSYKYSIINSLILTNNIRPSIDNIIDIGSSNNKWKSLYISSNINLNDAIIYYQNFNINFNKYLNTLNIITSNAISDYIETTNIYSSKSIISSNITSDYIFTSNLILSNIINHTDLITNSVNNISNLDATIINSSNITIVSSIFGNSIYNDNINTNDINISNNLRNINMINVSNIFISNGANIKNIIIANNIIPSQCNIYKLGGLDNKWKDLYLASNMIYLEDYIIANNSNNINILNSCNIYSSIILNNILLKNTNGDVNVNIAITDKNRLTFKSSNKSLLYSDINNIPNYLSCNFIFNNIIASNNALLYNYVNINSTKDINTLNINGKTISTYFKGSYIGNVLNISNILSTNIISNLLVANGGFFIPQIIFNNNNLISDKIESSIINSSYFGDAFEIFNINTSNINNNSFYNGTGCNLIEKNSIIIGNNLKPIIVGSNLIYDNIGNVLYINGSIIADKIVTDNLIINSNIFYGNASNIRNIVASNINGIIYNENGSLYNNIYSNIILNDTIVKINDNIISYNIYAYYNGSGTNISNILASNIINSIDIFQGGINNSVILSNAIWDDRNNKLSINNINSLVLQSSKFTGDSKNIYNINATKIINNNTLFKNSNSNQILFYDSNITSSSNIYIKDNNLIVIGNIFAKQIYASNFITSGKNISNINANNLIFKNPIITGGTNINNIKKYNLPFYDDFIINNSSNLYWENNKLNIIGLLKTYNAYSLNFIGDSINLSNIYSSNLKNNNKITLNQGGTNVNSINIGNILIGNNNDSILSHNELSYNNYIFRSKKIVTVTSSINNVNSQKIYSQKFIGDGKNISNIYNISGNVLISNGGTSLSNINKNELILNSNITWIDNNFTVKKNIYADVIYSQYNGDSLNISNIYTSNIIYKINQYNGGLINYINYYSNITYDNENKLLRIKDGYIYANNINASYYGNAINISNIISSNILNRVIPENILQDFLIGNNNIRINASVTSININSNLYSDNIYGQNFNGESANISNINAITNFSQSIKINQGGLNCNILNKDRLIYGDNDNISSSPNLYFNKNVLNIGGNLISKNIKASYYGNANNISNIKAISLNGNIIDKLNIFSTNSLNYYSNIYWKNDINKLIINGKINTNKIFSQKFIGNSDNISNIYSFNISPLKYNYFNSIITTENISNIYWNNNDRSLNINGKVYSYINFGKFIGDANNISNINSKNISGHLSNLNGGSGLSFIQADYILIGNGNTIMGSSKLSWVNNVLKIDSNLISKKIVSSYIGNGNISNIDLSNKLKGLLNINQGGLGCNNIDYGSILVGNNSNSIIISSNLNWDIKNNTLNTINIISKNIIANKFISSYNNLSNINIKNIKYQLNPINGVFGCNMLPLSYILIGNNSNIIITTNNLSFSNNLYSINLKSNEIYNNRINSKGVYSFIKIQSKFIGDGANVSNINLSKLNNNSIINIYNGGLNKINNNYGNLLLYDYLSYDILNNNFIVNGDIKCENINGEFIGNGNIINNIISSNIINTLGILNGAYGCNNILPNNLLVGNENSAISISNLSFINNKFKVEGNIYSCNFFSKGVFNVISNDINNITKNFTYLLASNMVKINNDNINSYGKLYFGNNSSISSNSSNIFWDFLKNSLNIYGTINVTSSNSIYSKYDSYNIQDIVSVYNGGLGTNYHSNENIYYGNDDNLSNSLNLLWKNNTDTLTTTIIYVNNIQGIFYGNANNLSNINATKLYNTFILDNGGTGKNILPYGNILIGNNSNSIIANPKLYWHNNSDSLTLNKGIIIPNDNIFSKFIGKGNNISNILIQDRNILGTIGLKNGCTSISFFTSNQLLFGNDSYPLLTSKKLNWDILQNKLNITGALYAKNIYTNSVYNFNAKDLKGILPIYKGGTDVNNINTNYLMIGGGNNGNSSIILSSNINWVNSIDTLNIDGNLYSKKIIGKLTGDGSMLSNIYMNNFNNKSTFLKVSNGGMGSNYYKKDTIFIGDGDNILNTDLLYFNSNLYTNDIGLNTVYINKLYGDGYNISNITITDLSYSLNVIYGGLSCNSIQYCEILIGNDKNPIYTSSNILWDINNSLYINDNIISKNLYGNIYGNGNNILNIQNSNIVNNLYVNNGGLSCNFINNGEILIGNGNKILTSSNLTWTAATTTSNNILRVNNNIILNKIISSLTYANILEGKFNGDALNVSNYTNSNFIGYSSVLIGGTGYDYINDGYLLIGNGYNKLLSSSNLFWNNNLNINGYVNGNDFYINKLYGDGQNISNYIFYASNMIYSDTVSVINGGTGNKSINNDELLFGNNSNELMTSCNLRIYRDDFICDGSVYTNNININGDILAKKISGLFYGNGIELSNINGNTIISHVSVINSGTGFSNKIPNGEILIGNNNNKILTSSNFSYNINEKILYVNGNINISNLLLNDANISDIICSNNLTVLNNTTYDTLYANKIITEKLIGDGINLSNISVLKINNIELDVVRGGLGCNNIGYGEILIGNNNTIITTSNLLWNNNLIIKGDLESSSNIYANNIIGNTIKSKLLLGDSINIFNYSPSNIIGEIPVIFGGTGYNYIDNCQIIVGNSSNRVIATSNLLWDNNNKLLYIKDNLSALSITCEDSYLKDIYSSNQIIVTGNSYYSNIIANIIQSKFIGDGINISNINASNILTKNLINLYKGNLLIGNNDNTLISTSNIIWDNNNSFLTINGSILSKGISNNKIYSKNINASLYYGDGYNISNINVNNIYGSLNKLYGGTGNNFIKRGQLLIGNNSNAILSSSNLIWDDISRTFTINGLINANSLNSKIINVSNIICSNLTVNDFSYHFNIVSKKIQGYYIGNGTDLSNILNNNIINEINVQNGGLDNNIINKTNIIIGGGNKIITTSNLIWSDNKLEINGILDGSNIISENIMASDIISSYIGDGILLSNINLNTLKNLNILDGNSSNNILLNVNNGGTGLSNINKGCLLIGNDTEKILISSNIIWDDFNKYLIINNKINTNIIFTKSINTSNILCSNINTKTIKLLANLKSKTINASFYGNGLNISNLQYNNFIGVIKYSNGGTNSNFIELGNILIGNGINDIYNTSGLSWNNNNLNIIGNIYNKSSFFYNINANNVYSYNLYGNGERISSILSGNIKGVFPVSCSGTGCNIINKNSILIGNNDKSIIITSNIFWKNNNLIINNIISVNNIISSNYVKSRDLVSTNITSSFCSLDNLITKNIYSTKFIGDSFALSNISLDYTTILNTVSNGGTLCSNINKGNILIGNDISSLYSSCNLVWDNNTLSITGDILSYSIINNNNILCKNIFSEYKGNGENISNIFSYNIKGVLPTTISGTGCNSINYGNILIGNNSNSIITSSNIIWNNITRNLNINGLLKTPIIYINNNSTLYNVITCNITLDIPSSYNNIYSKIIQSKYYGNALNISNINLDFVKDTILYTNGGTSSNFFNYGNILFSGQKSFIESCNISYLNNELIIKGDIKTSKIIGDNVYGKNVYNSYINGDGINLYNIKSSSIIGKLNIVNSGTGNNFINSGCVLIGNDINPINFSSNLFWKNNTLYINSNLNVSTISTVRFNINNYNTSNISVAGSVIINDINSKYIQSKFYGNGENCSNIILNNIIGLPTIISSKNIKYGNIIIGNNLNNINFSSNLSFYDNKLYSTNIITTNLKSYYLNKDNLTVNNLIINNKYLIKNIFYLYLDISSSSLISNNYVSFNLNPSLSSLNVNDYWINNCFTPPVNGVYSFDYSICTDTEIYIWFNKGNDFSNNNRHAVKYVSSTGSTNVILDCKISDNIYFGISSLFNGNILPNNLFSNTRASIALLQYL